MPQAQQVPEAADAAGAQRERSGSNINNQPSASARGLLRPDEVDVPRDVLQTTHFLTAGGLWFHLSRNREARSCRDAARKRWRLGHEGIPLWDELKSFLGSFADGNGRRQYVLVHCRADRRLNFEALTQLLGATSPVERVLDSEVAAIGLDYGLVNPFSLGRLASCPSVVGMAAERLERPVLQVFDADVCQPLGVPGTMMTNASSFTWAVEFHPRALVGALDHTLVGDVTEPDPEEEPRAWGIVGRRSIGIITGNAPESGIALWNNINAQVRVLLGPDGRGDVSMPQVVVHSMPEMGLSMELESRKDDVWRAIRGAVESMCERNIGIVTLACNTTHYFTEHIREICADNGAEFLSMPESTAAWLRARNVDRIALVGIRYVTDLGGWSAYTGPLSGIHVEPLSERALDLLDELAYRVKTEGVTEAGLSRLRDILRQEVSAQFIVLALTELSLLLAKQRREGKSGKVLIDPLAVYGEAVARRYLGLPFPAPPADDGF